ncbi:MAG TPA: hypothetical protein VG317_09575 [Pseudonocardiaceae bacterium]|nr:hypothetical protein [Pseudonocardiaceae bacterium]
MTDEPKTPGEHYRRQAAMVAGIVQTYGDTQRALREIAAAHESLIETLGMRDETAELLTNMAASEQRIRLIGQVNAAQALAYDALMSAGGPDDPEALAAYREATSWHNSLLTERGEGLPDR